MKLLICSIAATCAVTAAQAATITETTDFAGQALGDFLTTSSNMINVSEIGPHSIQGSLAPNCLFGDCGTSDEIDTFSINLAADLEIVSLILTMSNTYSGFSSSGISPDPVKTTFNITSNTPNAVAINNIIGDGTIDYSIGFGSGYLEGIYSFGVGIGAENDAIIVDMSADWRIDLVVESTTPSVPLPASALLLLAGLGGLGIARHRKRA